MADIEARTSEARFGLSGKLLGLTILFVILAEILIYVPSLANYYDVWLADRLGRARAAALVVDAAPEGEVADSLARDLLQSVGAHVVLLQTDGQRRVLAVPGPQPTVARVIDLRDEAVFDLVGDALDTLIFGGGNRVIQVMGHVAPNGGYVEVLLDEAPMRAAMFRFSRSLIGLSLVISAFTALLLYIALDRILVRPMRHLSRRMVAFRRHPENPEAILKPSDRGDEIGIAERELSAMQHELRQQLSSKERLAALGLAVSKINHDLRNLLASAQLASERLANSPDPTVRRLSAKLISTLERATAYCASTLAYGSAVEPLPVRRRVSLEPIAEDVREALGLGESTAVHWRTEIEPGLRVDADPDQLFRVLLNLGRNAVQAFENRSRHKAGDDDTLTILGRREGTGVVIEVSDNGPGLAAQARAKLFSAFQGSARPGGTGLGLPIAADIVRAHGGSIDLVESPRGATFRIVIPDLGDISDDLDEDEAIS